MDGSKSDHSDPLDAKKLKEELKEAGINDDIKNDIKQPKKSKKQSLTQISDDYWPKIVRKNGAMWEGNFNPNPWAWTDKHHEYSNEKQYTEDAPEGYPPKGYPLPGFVQLRSQEFDGPYNWPDNKVP